MDAKRLESVPLFADLSKHDREQVARWADEVDVREGTHLVDQGDFPYEFFVIEEGTAEVTRDGQHVAELGPGEFFGEMALLEEHRRTASVVSTSPMRLIVMHARDFHALADEMPEVADRIWAVLKVRGRR